MDDANAIVPHVEDYGFQAFMDSVEALIMGRKTYEPVLTLVVGTRIKGVTVTQQLTHQ